MRIGGLSARPPRSDDVAGALAGAVAVLGQRPAITALGADGRREQGFASLAGWVAKGANLLHLELGLGPGARVALAGPPGWPLAAVALSSWWVGATVVPAAAGGPADLRVLHGSVDDPVMATGERFWFGDGLDGTGATASGEQWTDAVTPHGDRPPPPSHDGGLAAIVDRSGVTLTQAALLSRFAEDDGGVLGMVRMDDEDLLARPDAAAALVALALRPLVTGSATVVIRHDDAAREQHAEAERVVRWYA